jgi:hypothetical protein
MQMRFFNRDGVPLLDVTCPEDHWEACEFGHNILSAGTIRDAEDFHILSPEEGSAFVHIDGRPDAALMQMA